MADALSAGITAAATLAGAGLGSFTTARFSRPFRREAALNRIAGVFEKRLPVYMELWKLSKYGPEDDPLQLSASEREELARKLRSWYYEKGGGLLLSGRAYNRWKKARDCLLSADPKPDEVWKAFSPT